MNNFNNVKEFFNNVKEYSNVDNFIKDVIKALEYRNGMELLEFTYEIKISGNNPFLIVYENENKMLLCSIVFFDNADIECLKQIFKKDKIICIIDSNYTIRNYSINNKEAVEI